MTSCPQGESPAAPSSGEQGKDKEKEKEKAPADMTISDILPIGQAVTFGGISGFCSGFVMKKIGKAAAVTFGFIVVGFQARGLYFGIFLFLCEGNSELLVGMELNLLGVKNEWILEFRCEQP